MTRIARIYGGALYELAESEGLETEILGQLQAVSGIFCGNPEYAALLSLPSLPKRERCGLLDESFRGRIHPYLLNFLKILTENGTVPQLPGCAEAYRSRFDEDHGILEVTAFTAVPLTATLQERLRQQLGRKTGKEIRLHNRVDSGVLGGVRLELEGKRLDGTVRGRLDELQAILRETVL